MYLWVSSDPSNQRGFFEWLSPLSGSPHSDRQPWMPYPQTYFSAFRFLPAPFFSPEYPSSYSPLQRYFLRRSDNACVCFLPPIRVWLFPTPPANVFQHHAGKLLLRISGS